MQATAASNGKPARLLFAFTPTNPELRSRRRIPDVKRQKFVLHLMVGSHFKQATELQHFSLDDLGAENLTPERERRGTRCVPKRFAHSINRSPDIPRGSRKLDEEFKTARLVVRQTTQALIQLIFN